MNLLKISKISFLIFLSLVLATPVIAANPTVIISQGLIATPKVNVQNTKITSQNSNSFKISFNIVNHEGVQAGIKYGVSLMRETTKGQFIADEQIYPDSLSLNQNSILTEEIKYTAPIGLAGDYTMLVKVTDSSGLVLGLGIAGQIKLPSSISTDVVEILPDTCYLSVVGEKGIVKYTLSQGVDISPTESLKLSCVAFNHITKPTSFVPLYETHYRTLSGEVVTQVGGDVSPISFKASERKLVSFILPKAEKPQAYDVKVSISSNGIFSNYVVVHYVLRGASATIQNFSLDKDYYKVKDIANLSFIWSPSADSFLGNRIGKNGTPLSAVTLTGTINDDKQQACISPINQVVVNGKIDLSIPVISNCNNPQASIQLKDSKGNILDQKILSFKTNIQAAAKESNTMMIFTIIGVLLVAGLAIYFVVLKKK